MVSITNPTDGSIVDCGDFNFTETGTQRFEVQTSEGTLFLEMVFGFQPSERLYQNKEWLHEQYVVKGRTMADIARQFGITPMSIQQWLNKMGIQTRGRGRRKVE